MKQKYELYHHGILGQRWGIRRFQNENGSLTSAGRERYNVGKRKTEADKEKKGLDPKTKKAIKTGAVIAGGILVTYGAYKALEFSKMNGIDNIPHLSETHDQAAEFGSSVMYDPSNGLELRKTPPTNYVEESFKVNPNFDPMVLSTTRNCGLCGIDMELRMRGYNTIAKGESLGMRTSKLAEYFKGWDSNSFCKIDIDPINLPKDGMDRGLRVKHAISDSINKQYSNSEKARGMLFVPGDYGSHWVYWLKEGTSVDIIEVQNPRGVNITKHVLGNYKYIRNNASAELKAIRLDNLEINNDTIHQVVQNATSGNQVLKTLSDEKYDARKVNGNNFTTIYRGAQRRPT